jgi:hypothetical protein
VFQPREDIGFVPFSDLKVGDTYGVGVVVAHTGFDPAGEGVKGTEARVQKQ